MSKGLDVAKSSLEKWTGKEREELVLLGGGILMREQGKVEEDMKGRRGDENKEIEG